jgi:hypothetical protein
MIFKTVNIVDLLAPHNITPTDILPSSSEFVTSDRLDTLLVLPDSEFPLTIA